MYVVERDFITPPFISLTRFTNVWSSSDTRKSSVETFNPVAMTVEKAERP
jgi:hypothetical protein